MCHCQKLGRWPLRDDSTGSFTWNKTGAYGSKQKWSSVCIKYNPWIGIEISLCLESHWANPKRWMDGSHYFDNHALPTQLCSSSFPFTSSWIFRKIAPQILEHMRFTHIYNHTHMLHDSMYLHGAGICTPTFARTKWPSFVGNIPAPWSINGIHRYLYIIMLFPLLSHKVVPHS